MENCIAYIEYCCYTGFFNDYDRTGPGKFTASFTSLNVSQMTYLVYAVPCLA